MLQEAIVIDIVERDTHLKQSKDSLSGSVNGPMFLWNDPLWKPDWKVGRRQFLCDMLLYKADTHICMFVVNYILNPLVKLSHFS